MSVFEKFQAAFETELTQLWESVRRKKQEAWVLLKDQINGEKEFRAFFEVHEEHFRPLQARVGELTRLKAMLTQRLEHAHTSIYRGADAEPGTVVEAGSGEGGEGAPRIRGGYIRPPSDDANPSSSSEILTPTGRKQVTRGVKAVGDMLRWIYHSRAGDQHTLFRTQRAQRVNELVSDPLNDEVELILKMPFETEDEAFWQEPRDPGRSPLEIQLELYYRYRLFDALLDSALPIARARAAAELHPLAAHFRECQRRGMPPRAYVLEIDGEIKATIRQLEADVITLQRALKSKDEDGQS